MSTPAIPYLPTVDDVGALLRARTKDTFGNEVGTFNANTRPTDVEVAELIDQAAQEVAMFIDTDIPDSANTLASSVVAIDAAMLVELSYWPETVGTTNSAYDRYKELFDLKIVQLQAAVTREELQEGDAVYAGDVQYQFPPMLPDWDTVIW